MPSADVEVRPQVLAQIQRRFPRAIGYGRATGPRHGLGREVARMERRGEIEQIRSLAKLDRRTGVLTIPYVRYKTPGQVRREQALKVGAVALVGSLAALGVGWLVWESRFALMALGAATAGIVLLAWLAPHWSRGCPGMHCPGCKG